MAVLSHRRGASAKSGSNIWKILLLSIVAILSVWFFLGYQFYQSLQQHQQQQHQTLASLDHDHDQQPKLKRAEVVAELEAETDADAAAAAAAAATSKQQQQQQQQQQQYHYTNIFPPKFPVLHDEESDLTISDDALAMCNRALWHTVETTTIVLPNDETFIHTGDIDDLWLRDSAAQVHPLLVPFFHSSSSSSEKKVALVQQDAKLARIVSGLIKRTAMYIRHDPYANAFRIDDSYVFSEEQKKMGRHDLISTWNYELDSACYYMRMLYYFYQALPDHAVLKDPAVHEAIAIMLQVWTAEQDHEGDAVATGSLLDCQNCGKPYRYPGLPRGGKGTPVGSRQHVGMTWTGFRPSDDATTYGYLVPANMFCVVVLGYVQEMATVLWDDPGMANKAKVLASEIDAGIQEHAIVEHETYGKMYAYEVDGLGNSLLMDDANVPSLMSIPYLGYQYDDDIYANTRRFILSHDNPTYQAGTNAATTGILEGYGSPHMSKAIAHNIWPMSLAVQGLSSSTVAEKVHLVHQLVQTTGGTGWMHESIDVSNPKKFTRRWFCWADALFAELVMTLTAASSSKEDSCPSTKYKVLEWRDPVQVAGGKFAA
eukprot:CAMPEP_0119010466 /NCGR_PEP_ID=MMETSP1176-20130426/5029_1 /TAXON_ID=265551 /ORGANISM="Synedropsis recta cf, Strain CCMP1620" /LENGTH=597 /DNA_ID=CAMNT_0006963131 /DNA_START=103 /DNA_END=1899 /DNA_ORIENTATION=-